MASAESTAVAGEAPAAPLTSGVPALDDLIDGVRVGDNLVVLADQGSALAAVGRAYVAAAPEPRRLVVTLTEPRLLGAIPDGATVLDDQDGPATLDALIEQLVAADEAVGRGATFLVDSLSGIQDRWGADAALELFLAICPRLYRRGSVAMWLLDARRHDRAFLDRLREITQVVVHLHDAGDDIDAEVLTAAGRAPTTPGRRQRLVLEDGALRAAGPVAAGRERLGELVRAQRIARGIAQAELARRVGITPSALSQVERGRRGLAAETLIRIWDALGVPFGPEGTVQRGYRVLHRSAHQDVELAAGVTGRLRYDEPGAGRCWEVTIAPDARGHVPLFSGKGTETVVLQRGVLDLTVGGHPETLHEGDSLVATHALIEGWANPGTTPVVALWTLLR